MRKILLLFATLTVLYSCYYDNEEYLYPSLSQCDTTSITFTGSVYPVLQQYCSGCHSGGSPAGNVALTNYQTISSTAANGSLFGVINGSPGFPQMPPDAPLPACQKTIIIKWIKNGYPNN